MTGTGTPSPMISPRRRCAPDRVTTCHRYAHPCRLPPVVPTSELREPLRSLRSRRASGSTRTGCPSLLSWALKKIFDVFALRAPFSQIKHRRSGIAPRNALVDGPPQPEPSNLGSRPAGWFSREDGIGAGRRRHDVPPLNRLAEESFLEASRTGTQDATPTAENRPVRQLDRCGPPTGRTTSPKSILDGEAQRDLVALTRHHVQIR